MVCCLNWVLVDPRILARGVNGWGLASRFKGFKQSKLLLKPGYLNLQGFNLILQGLYLGVGILNDCLLLLQLYLKNGTHILRLTELLLYPLDFDLILIQLLELLLDLPILGLDLLPGLSLEPLIQAPQLIQSVPVGLAIPPGILELHRHGFVGFVHFFELGPDAFELTGSPLLELLL